MRHKLPGLYSHLHLLRLQSHLSNEPWLVNYLFMTDPALKESNETMVGLFKVLSKQGFGVVQHHDTIDPCDIGKLKNI